MKYIIANWKSNKSREEVEKWLDEFEQTRFDNLDIEVAICPPMPSLMFVSNRLLDRQRHPQTYLGVQDISPFPAGSYTGAVSARNLEGFKVRYAIVGHSERRRYFYETHQDVANKVSQCLENNIRPIVCVDADYIQVQANALSSEMLERVIVAYEPLEAIGSGLNQPIAEVKPVVAEIKQAFPNSPVIYGGSVSAENIAEYFTVCDGALVGHKSLAVVEFTALIKMAAGK